MPPSVSKAQAKCRCEKCHNRMKCKQITPQAAGGRRLGHKDVFWQKILSGEEKILFRVICPKLVLFFPWVDLCQNLPQAAGRRRLGHIGGFWHKSSPVKNKTKLGQITPQKRHGIIWVLRSSACLASGRQA